MFSTQIACWSHLCSCQTGQISLMSPNDLATPFLQFPPPPLYFSARAPRPQQVLTSGEDYCQGVGTGTCRCPGSYEDTLSAAIILISFGCRPAARTAVNITLSVPGLCLGSRLAEWLQTPIHSIGFPSTQTTCTIYIPTMLLVNKSWFTDRIFFSQ